MKFKSLFLQRHVKEIFLFKRKRFQVLMVIFMIFCVTYYRLFTTCRPPNPWTQDHIKSHAMFPSYTDTALLKKDAGKASVEEIEMVKKFKVMTPTMIRNDFDQVLHTDENGTVWVVMANLPIFQYSVFN